VHERNGQSVLFASSAESWSVAPQAFAGPGRIHNPHWTGISLPRNVADRLSGIDQTGPFPLFEETTGASNANGTFLLMPLPVRAPSPFLSDSVDDSFLALRDRALQETGRDVLGNLNNLFEPLDAAPLPGQSSQTWNKAGRAFDLDPRSVLAFDSLVEVVREETTAGLYWRVFIRAAVQDGSQGEPLRQLPWDFRARYGQDARFYDEGGKIKESIPAGYYVDFTNLAADYGWERVAADPAWRTFYPGIRFWHYENKQGLNWEAAMLELYTLEEVEAVFPAP
jgi:TolB protein